jgi:hypothetical protein
MWRPVVNTVTNIRDSQNSGNCFTNSGSTAFSRRALRHCEDDCYYVRVVVRRPQDALYCSHYCSHTCSATHCICYPRNFLTTVKTIRKSNMKLDTKQNSRNNKIRMNASTQQNNELCRFVFCFYASTRLYSFSKSRCTASGKAGTNKTNVPPNFQNVRRCIGTVANLCSIQSV